MIDDKTEPVVALLERYKEMSKDGIIGHFADWFNVVGQVEFDNAIKNWIIIAVKDRRDQWKLANPKMTDIPL